MKITFLTPRLPPSVCGLGDHTVQLARAVREHVDRVTAIDLYGDRAAPNLPFDQIDRWDCSQATLPNLLEMHGTDVLWVQYSGYGYGFQGVPQFLARALHRLRGQVSLAAYFHQTHCRVKQLGWKGVLVSPWQSSIAKRIAGYADVVLTSCELYRQLIENQYEVSPERLFQLPIGSNIPVLAIESDSRQRVRSKLGFSPVQRVAVVFGSAGTQAKTLAENSGLLVQAVRRQLIDQIVCVGGTPGMAPDSAVQCCDSQLHSRIVEMGHLSASRVAEVLTAADVALTWCPLEKFGKSGVVMAYAMAGLPVLTAATDDRAALGHTGTFVTMNTLEEFQDGENCDIARTIRQKRALAAIGWPALAAKALQILESSSVSLLEA